MALTFDAEHPDRPDASAGAAERILDVLEDAGARATFFLKSRWAMANPHLARRIADAGHLVGNHSTYHARMTLFSDDGIRVDVRQAGDTIAELAGVDPRPWFRCPFGDGHDDRRVNRGGRRRRSAERAWRAPSGTATVPSSCSTHGPERRLRPCRSRSRGSSARQPRW